jgi:hypothetical protein
MENNIFDSCSSFLFEICVHNRTTTILSLILIGVRKTNLALMKLHQEHVINEQ